MQQLKDSDWRVPSALFVVIGVFWLAVSATAYFGAATPLFMASDRYADFIKVVLAASTDQVAHDPLGFDYVTERHDNNHYSGKVGLHHLPPLSMMLTLLTARTFAWISPMLAFFVLALTWVAALYGAIRNNTNSWVWAAVAFVSYPVVVLIDRGNLFAGLVGVCLIIALLRRKADWIAVALCAVALNIRPNAILCVLPLILLSQIDWRFALRLVAAIAATALVSIAISNALDPTYTLDTFSGGIRAYSETYVIAGRGVPFGASAYGALYLLGLPSLWIATLAGSILVLPALALRIVGRMGYGNLVFVCAASTALGTAVFADYHLIIFLAPLLLATNPIAAIASALVLVPKGFGSIDGSTWQVIANPAILFFAVVVVVVQSFLVRTKQGRMSAEIA